MATWGGYLTIDLDFWIFASDILKAIRLAMAIEAMDKWTLIASRPGPRLPLFEVELRKMRNPRNQIDLEAVVLHAKDTVNIVALTGEGDLLLVEQFRFGIDDNLLELPAGLIDGDEDPAVAARRELLEETGYMADTWTALGWSYLNPAYVDNRCFHFLAEGAVKAQEPLPQDSTEHLRLRVIPRAEISGFLAQNGIVDAVGLAAMAKVFPPSRPATVFSM